MASLRVLPFDHEGRSVQFDTWLDDLQLYLLSDIKDGVSLFDHVSGPAAAPPTTGDSATRSQWLSRDAAARLAIRNHLLLAKCAHFGQHRTAQALYDDVVARYSSTATAALGRMLLPYLFPELSAFATVEDLPPMFITLYFIVTRLPDSLRYVRDNFLSLDPTSLTVDLLEQHLLTAGVVVGAAVEVVAVVGLVEGVGALVAAVEAAVGVAAVAAVGLVEVGLALDMLVLEVASISSSSVGAKPRRPSSFTCGRSHTQHRCFSRLDNAWRAEFGDDVELPCWADLLKSRIAIFDLDFDAFFLLCIAAAALGARESGSLPGTAPAEALHTFTLTQAPLLVSFVTAPPSLRSLHLSRSDWLTPLGARSLPVPPLSSRVWRFRPAHRSSLYTLATEPSQVAASAQVSASCQVAASCSCRLLSHQTLLWHHRLGHPSLPRIRGMHSRLLVSGLPRSLPPLPPLPAPPCLPCVEGQQRAAPHSSSFPSTTAPLHTLHMDDLHALRLHSYRGGEFSSNLLQDFCRGEGILQSFTLPDSPQQNGIAECRIGLVMEVARTSMIHAAAPHFLWPFTVRYAAHQLNLWPRVSLPETSPTLHWTGEVGDASVFRVWGSRAFVCDTSADKLSPHAIPCVFLGFVPDAPGWQFYHPTSCRVFPSQDEMLDESVPFYRLFPYRSAPPPPPLLFLTPDPLPGPAPVQVAVGSGAAPGAASGGVESGGAEPGGAESKGAETRGAEPGGVETGGGEPTGTEPEGVEPGGATSEGAESGGAEPQGAASSGGFASASPRPSPQQLREWFVRRARLRSGATRAGGTGAAGAGGTGSARQASSRREKQRC
ncbi:unnamed protein product [Closterium sp. NIES-53]